MTAVSPCSAPELMLPFRVARCVPIWQAASNRIDQKSDLLQMIRILKN
jgi:hypothetical protein